MKKTKEEKALDKNYGPLITYKRTGRCTPSKCGSACCKLVTGPISGNRLYDNNFGKQVLVDEYNLEDIDRKTHTYKARKKKKKVRTLMIEVTCRKLNNKGKCILHKGKKPTPCKQFPHINDATYQCVKDKCTYKFEKILNETNSKQDKGERQPDTSLA